MYTYTSVSGKLAKEAIQGHSGQMSSKTKLVGLGIFRCGNEKSVHGRPSWELGLHDCSSQMTADFASRYKLGSKECHFSERARECRVVHFSTQFFILDKADKLTLINLKTRATQWRVGVGKQRGTKVREVGERSTGSGRLWLWTPCPPPPPSNHQLHHSVFNLRPQVWIHLNSTTCLGLNAYFCPKVTDIESKEAHAPYERNQSVLRSVVRSLVQSQ